MAKRGRPFGAYLKNLSGSTAGKWTILNYAGDGKWHCRCSCGAYGDVPTNTLRRSKSPSRSCGCFRKEKAFLRRELTNRNHVLSSYKSGAKQRGLAWELSDVLFDALIHADCHYCHIAPRLNWRGFFSNGIDRKDSTVGYIAENVVPCCCDCNRAKSDMSYDSFFAYIRRLTGAQHNGLEKDL